MSKNDVKTLSPASPCDVRASSVRREGLFGLALP